jgi:hypothetical protein
MTLAVATPDGHLLVQMPGEAWKLFDAAKLSATETDGKPVATIAERLKVMTAVLVAPGGKPPAEEYLKLLKPGTMVLVLPNDCTRPANGVFGTMGGPRGRRSVSWDRSELVVVDESRCDVGRWGLGSLKGRANEDPRRYQWLFLQGVEGNVLSRGPAGREDAGVLRRAV